MIIMLMFNCFVIIGCGKEGHKVEEIPGNEIMKEEDEDSMNGKSPKEIIEEAMGNNKLAEDKFNLGEGEGIPFKYKKKRATSYGQEKNYPWFKVYGGNSTLDNELGYSSNFFNTGVLVHIKLKESSGSVLVGIKNVTKDDNVVTIFISEEEKGIGTTDMAFWDLYVELDKSYFDDETVVQVQGSN